jgi:hypothetical protein
LEGSPTHLFCVGVGCGDGGADTGGRPLTKSPHFSPGRWNHDERGFIFSTLLVQL